MYPQSDKPRPQRAGILIKLSLILSSACLNLTATYSCRWSWGWLFKVYYFFDVCKNLWFSQVTWGEISMIEIVFQEIQFRLPKHRFHNSLVLHYLWLKSGHNCVKYKTVECYNTALSSRKSDSTVLHHCRGQSPGHDCNWCTLRAWPACENEEDVQGRCTKGINEQLTDDQMLYNLCDLHDWYKTIINDLALFSNSETS